MGRKKRLPRLQDVVTWGEMTDNQVIFNHNGTFQKLTSSGALMVPT